MSLAAGSVVVAADGFSAASLADRRSCRCLPRGSRRQAAELPEPLTCRPLGPTVVPRRLYRPSGASRVLLAVSLCAARPVAAGFPRVARASSARGDGRRPAEGDGSVNRGRSHPQAAAGKKWSTMAHAHDAGTTTTGGLGWTVFAACAAVLIGSFQAIAGLVALTDVSYYQVPQNALAVHWSYTVWGGIHLALGVLLVAAGFGLLV